MEKEKIKLLSALIEKPSTYKIKVEDSSMMPREFKDKEVFELKVKPPSLHTLSRHALHLVNIPEAIRNTDDKTPITIEDAVKCIDDLVGCIFVLSHLRDTDWGFEFIKKNIQPIEAYYLFVETKLKTQTDFFLSSFQSALGNNPMMMNEVQDSTPINS